MKEFSEIGSDKIMEQSANNDKSLKNQGFWSRFDLVKSKSDSNGKMGKQDSVTVRIQTGEKKVALVQSVK